MQENDAFFKSLAKDLKPVVPLKSLRLVTMQWIFVSVCVLVIAVILHKIRPDLFVVATLVSFRSEFILAFIVGGLAAREALELRVPNARVSGIFLSILLGLWLVSLVVHSYVMNATQLAFNFRTELACMICIVAFAALPFLLLVRFVKKGASTQPQRTLMRMGIASSAMAAAFLPFACPNDGLTHLLVGHALPLFTIGFVSWSAGGKVLRW